MGADCTDTEIEIMTPLAQALKAAGLVLFRNESGYPKRDAQRNLEGRTRYADDNTLRHFHARIVAAGRAADGSYYWLIESVALDMDNARRGFRGVVFDVLGDTIEHPSLDQTHRTSKQARKAMWDTLNAFDLGMHYRIKLDAYAARLEGEAAQMRAAAAMLREEATA